MEDLNSILEQYGITETIPANDEAVESVSHQEENVNLSDVDVNDILSSYNFTEADNSEEDIEEENAAPLETTVEEDIEEEISEEPVQSTDDSKIPVNSPTLLLDDSTSRFSGAEWYKEIQKASIIIGGMGGISSHLAFNIARMSPTTIVMYDDDIVETANMSGQLYSRDDVGRSKVDAIESMLRKYASVGNIYAIKEKFNPTSEAGDIMICGFDNMMARKLFYFSWKKHVISLPEEQRSKCLFLDGRLSLTVMQILCITGNDEYNMSRYEKEFLFSDSEADETVCSMKQTTYLASMIGAMMTNLFTNFIANTIDPVIPYALPFFTEYDAQYMIFKIEN